MYFIGSPTFASECYKPHGKQYTPFRLLSMDEDFSNIERSWEKGKNLA